MELRSTEEFLEAAVSAGLDPGGRSQLMFTPDRVERRFWKIPESPTLARELADALLAACGVWSELWMGAGGAWDGIFPPGSEHGEPWHARLRTLGVPPGYRGSVRFTPAQRGPAVDLLAAEMSLGQTNMCDLRIFGRPAEVSLYVEHHGVVWVHTRASEGMDRVVAEMERLGFPLPADYPDDTFKPVSWIPPHQEEQD